MDNGLLVCILVLCLANLSEWLLTLLQVMLMVLEILVKKNCMMHVQLLRYSGLPLLHSALWGASFFSAPDMAPIIADSS